MRQGKPQKYGTQYVAAGPRWRVWTWGKRYRLWDVDPATTDAERAEWGVPPLAAAQDMAQKVGDLQASLRLGPTLASLEVPGLWVEVQDLSWARAAMPDSSEPRPEPLRAGEKPDVGYLPADCTCWRARESQGLVGADGRVLATWQRYPVEAGRPFIYGWRWAESPALGVRLANEPEDGYETTLKPAEKARDVAAGTWNYLQGVDGVSTINQLGGVVVRRSPWTTR